MQNAGPSYQGSAQQGVNFSDRSYENQIGAHCQPTSYQPYINAPYHPVTSPRPHHYGNHQMQQGIPYNSVHHGGAYAPNQNQYGPSTNQDMYRNHHPAYVGGNNRNMPTKPVWGENTIPNADMMQPYNQLPPQAQMMNNPPQMPVSAMRSPPQGTPMNMNPAQSPGPQHYRQLPSPNHSPHSWPQVQVPSPGILHSTRTTPSPLSTHVRSPGHSQPFSPPAAAAHHSSIPVNMQTHTSSAVQDNECVSNMSNTSNKESVLNPLHSLQKMVMLDQEMKPNLMQLKCEVTNDNCDQIISQSSELNVAEGQDAENESKDSSYSTYFNLDEKCIDSQAQVAAVVNVDYSNASSVTSIAGCNSPSAVPLNTLSKPKDDSPKNIDTCMENADNGNLKSYSEQKSYSNDVDSHVANNQEDVKSEDSSNVNFDSGIYTAPVNSETVPELSTPSEEMKNEVLPENLSNEVIKNEEVKIVPNPPLENLTKSSPIIITTPSEPNSENICNIKSEVVCDLVSDVICKEENEVNEKDISNLNSCETVSENCAKSPKPNLRRRRVGVSYEEIPSPVKSPKIDMTLNSNEIKVEEKSPKKLKEVKILDKSLQRKPRAKKCEVTSERPVKVVIHRIRKSDTDDTWHVPNYGCGSHSQENDQSGNSLLNDKAKESPKVSNIGPQIIILSPAMSKKKFGTAGSGNPNSVITINEDKTVVETVDGKVVSETTKDSPEQQLNNKKSSEKRLNNKKSPEKQLNNPKSPEKQLNNQKSPEKQLNNQKSPEKQLNNQKSPKKAAVVSKQKRKPAGGRTGARSTSSKKGKGKKNARNKRKFQNTNIEVTSKVKRLKVFNGPYVHITGSKQNPVSIKVVNVAPREEEKDPRQQKPKREFGGVQREFGSIQKKIRVGHSCTLSPHYDAFNKDKTWLCSFCHKGSHHHGLGDLYGPYYINGVTKPGSRPTTSNEQVPTETVCTESETPQAPTRGTRSKRRKSELLEECVKTSSTAKKSKQAKRSNAVSSPNVTPMKLTQNTTANIPTITQPGEPKSPEPTLQEVWIHEDCVVWCQGVSLMGQQIHGLDEAINEAVENVCSACKLVGATLGCWSKGCTQQYHYSCAKEKGCEMDIDVFSLLCPNHVKKQRTNEHIKVE